MCRYPCVFDRLARLFAAGVILLALDPGRASAGDSSRLPFTHVRASHPRLVALLQAGYDRSPSFRQLVGDLESSAWLVFVQNGACPTRDMVGCLLHFVGRFEGRPYVRIVVHWRERHPDQVIATLAHELQHAREVATAPDVVDVTSMLALFQKIGYERFRSGAVTLHETTAARHMGEQVLEELSSRAHAQSARR